MKSNRSLNLHEWIDENFDPFICDHRQFGPLNNRTMIIQDLFCCHFVCVFEAFSNRIFELFRCFHKMWETELSICQTLERTADFQIYNCLAENEMFPIYSIPLCAYMNMTNVQCVVGCFFFLVFESHKQRLPNKHFTFGLSTWNCWLACYEKK